MRAQNEATLTVSELQYNIILIIVIGGHDSCRRPLESINRNCYRAWRKKEGGGGEGAKGDHSVWPIKVSA